MIKGKGRAAGILASALLLLLTLPASHQTDGLAGGGEGAAQTRGADIVGPPVDPARAVQLSTSPRVFLYQGLLSDGECDYLINAATQRVDPVDGQPFVNATFLRKYQDGVVRKVEDRINEWIYLARESPDAIKVLRYNEGQKYDVHWEFFDDGTQEKLVGVRVATIMLFLSNVVSGGEIVFPEAQIDTVKAAEQRRAAGPNGCAAEGLVVKPSKGSALLLFHLDPQGTAEGHSEYKECPVKTGERWMASKWLRIQKYSTRRDPNECTNEHPQCEMWANMGECAKNPEYMVGRPGSYGNCRKACKVCTPKAPVVAQ